MSHRTTILLIGAAVGAGLLGMSTAAAAPANGAVIGKAASTEALTQEVVWRCWGWRRGWGWHGGWRRPGWRVGWGRGWGWRAGWAPGWRAGWAPGWRAGWAPGWRAGWAPGRPA